MRYGEVRGRLEDVEAFAQSPATPREKTSRRINLEPEKVERGLAQLVLSLLELIRQLMEKQALRRIGAGDLGADQIERLGTTLMRLEEQMQELKRQFQVDNLNIDLGPLGTLVDD